MSGERGGHAVGTSLSSIILETLHRRIAEQATPSVGVHHPVGEPPIAISFHESKRYIGLSSS
jgi:hypothetical protein